MPPLQGYDMGGVEDIPAAPGEYMFRLTQLELGNTMVQSRSNYADTYFPGISAGSGAQAMIQTPMPGVQQARVPLPRERMPLPSGMMEVEHRVVEPVLVNPKQYGAILRRRQSRAKAESENNTPKTRKKYLHDSRHQHAIRRARGSDGQFLNTKGKEQAAAKAEADPRAAEGQSSNGNHNTESHTTLSSQGLQDGGLSSQGVPTLQQLLYSTGLLSPGHIRMVQEGPVGGYHNQQPQSFQRSAFHPLPGGADASDGSQGGTHGIKKFW